MRVICNGTHSPVPLQVSDHPQLNTCIVLRNHFAQSGDHMWDSLDQTTPTGLLEFASSWLLIPMPHVCDAAEQSQVCFREHSLTLPVCLRIKIVCEVVSSPSCRDKPISELSQGVHRVGSVITKPGITGSHSH